MLAVCLVAPPQARADGCFVFKWDKEKDINEPTQKAIIVHDAGQQDLILQVKYEGPPEDFGWLIPVPSVPKVEKASMECFYELSQLTQRRFGVKSDKGMTLGAESSRGQRDEVKVIEIKTVGDYEIAVLSAQDGGSLERWLQKHGFSIPKNKNEIIETYIQQDWYFIAVRVALGKQRAVQSKAELQNKLADGELHPLHVSFASEECVFPLKISAVNGKPSEVSLYIISSEPLVNKELFDKNRRARRAQWEKDEPENRRSRQQIKKRSSALRMSVLLQDREQPFTPLRDQKAEDLEAAFGRLQGPEFPDVQDELLSERAMGIDLLSYIQVDDKTIPECMKHLPRLKGKQWYLVKEVRTFAPEEMKDLTFVSVVPILAELLSQKEGAAAAQLLARLGKRAEAVLTNALQNTDRSARIHASTALVQLPEPPPKDVLLKLLKDSEREVRMNAIYATERRWDTEFANLFVDSFTNEDVFVRGAITSVLRRHFKQVAERSSVFVEALKDSDPLRQASAVHAIYHIRDIEISRDKLLPLLSSPYEDISAMALQILRPLSSEETIPLLKNNTGLARLSALRVLRENADAGAVELAISLLNDPEEIIRKRAGSVVQAITKQTIPYDQPERWKEWWAANKSTFQGIKPK